MDIGLLIDGADRAARRRRDPSSASTRSPARRRRAPPPSGLADVEAAVDAAAAAFPAWSKTGPGERRALLMKAADVLASKVGEFTAPDDRGDRRHRRPGPASTSCSPPSMLREAAAMTTQIAGEVIPSDKPGTLAMGIRQPAGVVRRHRAVECAGHPRHARRRHAARLRQHGGAQGLRDVPRHAPADRPGVCRGRPAARA